MTKDQSSEASVSTEERRFTGGKAKSVAESHALICSLIDNFEFHKVAYLQPTYSESQFRSDFIDKFLTALGWDVGHVHQKNPFKQEVKVERSIQDRGSKKRADYALFIADNFRDPRLFIEVKNRVPISQPRITTSRLSATDGTIKIRSSFSPIFTKRTYSTADLSRTLIPS